MLGEQLPRLDSVEVDGGLSEALRPRRRLVGLRGWPGTGDDLVGLVGDAEFVTARPPMSSARPTSPARPAALSTMILKDPRVSRSSLSVIFATASRSSTSGPVIASMASCCH
jgi:hypothetical protein